MSMKTIFHSSFNFDRSSTFKLWAFVEPRLTPKREGEEVEDFGLVQFTAELRNNTMGRPVKIGLKPIVQVKIFTLY